MEFLSGLFAIALIVFRIGVPIYLYTQAWNKEWPKPGLWILFGIFEPITALMIFYLIVHILPSREPFKG
ncbi:MAG TPA: hypothetical protein GX528_00245 [Firmicutes bacterium]|nr:hypothetical protein [Bacillota bacterium]